MERKNCKSFFSPFFLLFFFFVLVIISCNKDVDTSPKELSEEAPSNGVHSEQNLYDGLIQLGQKLENPYSVENMRKAYKELVDKGLLKSSTEIKIDVSHLYVRFLPKDTAEFFLLDRTPDLLLYDYPLDYEIVQEGSYYHDPSIPEDQFTWFYTTVSVDFEFPEVEYEVLAECFIPEDDELKSESYSVYSKVEDLALLNAGYVEIAKNNDPYNELKGLRRPEGTIRVWDNEIGGWTPVRGVTIRCQLGVKIGKGTTNERGFYRIDARFRLGPHYRMFFYPDNGTYTIRNVPTEASLREAHSYGLGYHNKRGHNRDIRSSSSAAPFCIISNAAFDYYNWCRNNNISLPPRNLGIWAIGWSWIGASAPMISRINHPIHVNTNSGWNTFFLNMAVVPLAYSIKTTAQLLGVRPDITLNTNSSHRNLYSSTCHELAHASHFSNVGSWYWTQYIAYIITFGAYGSATDKNAGICGVGEMWGFYIDGLLTSRQYGGDRFDTRIYWFEHGIIRQLTSNALTWRPRLTNPLTEKQIFDCLTSDVRSHTQLRNRLIQRYGRQQEITAVFTHFGF